jgi:putative Holliday junction resolvase
MPRVLGIDYGEKRIGLAIGDTSIGIAHPHSVIESDENAIMEIAEFIKVEGIELIIVGLPRSLSGEEGIQAEAVRRFANSLHKITGIEIAFWDERLSSKEAEEILIKMDKSRRERKELADAHQAAVILQTYLDSMGDD